ncbi:MAG: sialidase family protein [Vicinamibacterales bacterium]
MIVRRAAVLAVLAVPPVLLLASGCGREEAPVTLAVDGRVNANVSMAADGPFVAAVWSAADESGATDVFSAVSTDAGRSFASPVRVNSAPGDAKVNAEQPPRLALKPRQGAAPEIAVVWTTKGETGTSLLTSTSVDGGRAFGASRIVPGSDAVGNRGWESIASMPGGGFMAAWLDHRLLAAPQSSSDGEHAHMHEGSHAASSMSERDGVATAQLSQIYVAPVESGADAHPVAAGVCYCCKTAIAAVSDTVLLAWRHVYAGNMRDIAFTRSNDGGRTFAPPVRISEDNWHLEGCPDDGPAMGVDAEGTIYIVWPSVIDEAAGPVKSLFLTTSTDGQHFAPRQQLPTVGQAHHPQISVARDGAVAVVWDESGEGTRQLAAIGARRAADGVVHFGEPVRAGDVGMYPTVVWSEGRWLRAWTAGDPGHSVVRVAPVRLTQ